MLAAGGVAVLLSAASLVAVSIAAPEPAAAATTVPTLDCSTAGNFINTGSDSGGKQLANGVNDDNWLVSGGTSNDVDASGKYYVQDDGFHSGSSPNQVAPSNYVGPIELPPDDAVWNPAQVGKVVSAWGTSGTGATWISHNYSIGKKRPDGTSYGNWVNSNNDTYGDWYYKYTFKIADGIDPSTVSMDLQLFSDNAVAQVWTNGVPYNTDGASLQGDDSPYTYNGYRAATAAEVTLAGNWTSGENTIIIQVKSGPGAEGLGVFGTTNKVCDPSITVEKTASVDKITKAGDTVTYSFLITNTGNVTLSDVNVTDDAFSGTGSLSEISYPKTTLAAGESMTATATYTATQADVDAGSLTNTATSHGTPPGSPPVDSPPSKVVIPSPPTPAITVVKTASEDEFSVGDTVTYSFLITNTGNVTLTDVNVTDDDFSGTGKLSDISYPTTTLAPGESTTATATYVVTQADVDAGSLENTATAHGTPPGDTPPPTSPPSKVVIPSPPTPSISVVKSATPKQDLKVGETVTYSFLITNTGNVTLTDVNVTDDDFSGTGKLSDISYPTTTLAPGESTTATATYVVTQADVDAGSITNTATSHGTPPDGGTPPDSPPSKVVIPEPPTPAITVEKTASVDEIVKAGEEITYSFLITNTGNVTLTDVNVTDDDFSGTGKLSDISYPTTTLAPGESTTATATYVVTQADVDAGSLENTATSHGTPPGDTPPPTSPPSKVIIPSPPTPAITVVKTASEDEFSVGDTVTYSFLITNTGNVTLTDVNVTDDDFSGTGKLSDISYPTTTLAPGESTTATATYVVTQADVDAGSLENTATAHGTPPGDTPPPTSPPSKVIIPSPPTPAITVVKSASTDKMTKAGEEITYSFLITNTGNVTLTDVNVTDDDFSGTGKLSDISYPTTTLAPGESTTATATYVVTQADVDAGSLENTATSHGTPPGDTPPPTSPPSKVIIPSPPTPAITVVKTASEDEFSVGDTVTYSFLITNTGNVTLTDVNVTDDDFSGTGKLSDISYPTTTLAPGESTTATATYVVTQADVDAGSLENTATAHGTPPGDTPPPTSPPSKVIIPSPPTPAITVVKTASGEQFAVGDTVTYSFLITNTGNVTLTDVNVTDEDFTGTGTLSDISYPKTTLAPGESMTATATYVVTSEDVDAGKISNAAISHGTPPGDNPPVDSPPSRVVVVTPPPPGVITHVNTGGYLVEGTTGDPVVWIPLGASLGTALLIVLAFALRRGRREESMRGDG